MQLSDPPLGSDLVVSMAHSRSSPGCFLVLVVARCLPLLSILWLTLSAQMPAARHSRHAQAGHHCQQQLAPWLNYNGSFVVCPPSAANDSALAATAATLHSKTDAWPRDRPTNTNDNNMKTDDPATQAARLPVGGNESALPIIIGAVSTRTTPGLDGMWLRAPRLPALDWKEPRSDWLSVKALGARGDGLHDDTAAIQAALDLANNRSWVQGDDSAYCREFTMCSGNRTIYFPPGNYRLTATLTNYRLMGGTWIGHGERSVLSWHGPANGCMLHSIGWARSRYIGLVWDGRGVAKVGVNHDPTSDSTPHASSDSMTRASGACGKPAYR